MAIKINVSENAAEKPRVRGKLPLGWYHLRIADVELKESKSERNSGKPMYNFELEITDDPRNPQDANGASEFAGRPEWVNACLWDGAEFTIVGIMNALGKDVKPGELSVPDITDPNDPDGGLAFFVGKGLLARYGIRKKERAAAAKEGRKAEPEWTQFAPENPDTEQPQQAGGARGGATTRRRVLA